MWREVQEQIKASTTLDIWLRRYANFPTTYLSVLT
jgi:hypothetical protein